MSAKRNRKTMFLSHSATDRAYALGLKEILEEAFAGRLTCYLSSDHGVGTAPGIQWFDKTRAAIRRSELALVLASRRSIHRPWSSFEAGAACFAGAPLMVLCIGGLGKDELPPPLSAFPVVDSTRSEDCHHLLKAVAAGVGLPAPEDELLAERLLHMFAKAPPGQPAPAAPLGSGEAEGEEERELTQMEQLRFRFWRELIARGRGRTRLHSRIGPKRENWTNIATGREGLYYTYVIWPSSVAVDLSIDLGKGRIAETKELFDQLYLQRVAIEREFGAPLEWDPNPDRRLCRIRHLIEEGGLSNREQWVEIQERMVEALVRMEQVVANHL